MSDVNQQVEPDTQSPPIEKVEMDPELEAMPKTEEEEEEAYLCEPISSGRDQARHPVER